MEELEIGTLMDRFSVGFLKSLGMNDDSVDGQLIRLCIVPFFIFLLVGCYEIAKWTTGNRSHLPQSPLKS